MQLHDRSKGRTYCHNRHHIFPHTQTQNLFQDHPCIIPGPLEQQDPPISGPYSNKNSPITRPSSGTLPETTSSPQKDPIKQSKQSYIPTPKYPASSRCSLATNSPVNKHLKSTSCIPISQSKPFPRPSHCSTKPVPTSQNNYASTITRPLVKVHPPTTISRPSVLTPGEIINFLTHLIIMNDHSAATEERQKPNAEAIPVSSADPQNPVNWVSQPVSHKSIPALVQKMTQIQIPHPVMTCSPLQAELPQPATEHLDPEYPLITIRPY